jgi:hypothetical protein
VPTGKRVNFREECHWSHACMSFKRAGVGSNGILECKFPPKTRTVRLAQLPTGVSAGVWLFVCITFLLNFSASARVSFNVERCNASYATNMSRHFTVGKRVNVVPSDVELPDRSDRVSSDSWPFAVLTQIRCLQCLEGNVMCRPVRE